MTAYDVFVSCAAADQAVADAVCTRLESIHQVRCWIASRDVPEGASEVESSLDALDQSRVMVLIFSGPDTTSMPIAREVARAVQQGINILPFRIDPAIPVEWLDHGSADVDDPDSPSAPLGPRVARLAQRVRALVDEQAPAVLTKAASKGADPSWSKLAMVGGAAFLVVLLVFALGLPNESARPVSDSAVAPSTSSDAGTAAKPPAVSAAAPVPVFEPPLAPTSPTGLDVPFDASPSASAERAVPRATLDDRPGSAPGSALTSAERSAAPTPIERGTPVQPAGNAIGPAIPAPDSSSASSSATNASRRPLPAPVEPSVSSGLTMSGTLLIDFVNSLPDGTVELEIDGHIRWSERLRLTKPTGALAALKLQRASEQLGSELRVPAGDHKITVTILNADGEVWDFGTTSLHVDASRTVTLRIRLSRFRNRLRLESAAG